ncbi:MAG TPA: hypothetical protein VEM15_00165, partial [Thermodesulfobacteriota bacterium]|nr:hypothetical protein [Thermodesulfobacteriota bacterium]
MIATIVMFIVVAVASADDHERKKFIHGEYGFNGGGSCVSTPSANWTGVDFTLTDPTNVSSSSFESHGIVTFEKNGTGTLDVYVWTIPIPPAFSAGYVHITSDFTYTLGPDGAINYATVLNSEKYEILNADPTSATFGHPSGVVLYRDHSSLTGWVSADQQTIVLASPAPEIDTLMLSPTKPVQKVICHESHTCVR